MSWKEQAVAIPIVSEALVLEGVWQAGSGRAAVIAPPHPEYGGSFDNPVVSELAYALHRNGYASLRFNWRGVGASQGRISGDAGPASADYLAAIDHLASTQPGPILGAGYSFGAATALRVALREPRVRELLLVAPPVAMIERLPLADLGRPVHVIVGSRDAFASAADLSELFGELPGSTVEVIAGADHFFRAGLALLGQLVRQLCP